MDLLRFLASLPLRLARGLAWILALILRPLFGQMSWSAPAWVPVTGNAARSHPLKFAGTVAAVLVVLVGGWFGWHWWQNRPKPVEPNRVTFQVAAPAVTSYDETPITIHPLIVRFSGSAAKIEALHKPVTDGIAMSPKLAGAWTWDNDRQLRFVPAEDWPVGKHVEVRLDKVKLFAPQIVLADDHFDFDTAPFTARIASGEFYQDPQTPTMKKTIVQVAFNYPVDPAQFEKKVSLQRLDAKGGKDGDLKFTVTYDDRKLNAYVHSQPLDLPRDDSAVRLVLDKGTRSVRGGDGTDNELTNTVKVPGLYSLKIDDISASLVDNEKFEPEQVMVINVGGAVSDTDLAKRVHAWVLPKYQPGGQHDEDAPPDDWSIDQVDQKMLKGSNALKLDVIPTENDYAELQSFRFKAEPGQRIYVRVENGLTSFGGYVLGQPVAQVVTVPDYPRLLRFMADGALLSMSGAKRVSVVSRNMPGMKLEIGRVQPDQLQHLVSLNGGTYAKPQMYGLTSDHIVDRFEQKTSFPAGDPGKAHYEGVDLGKYLASGKKGVFLLKLTGYDEKAEKKAEAAKAKAEEEAANGAVGAKAPGDDAGDDSVGGQGEDSDPADGSDGAEGDSSADSSADVNSIVDERLVVVTDLGVLAKQSVDGSQDVFVQSIRTGSPVPGARVSVVAENGQELFTGITAADGMVHFASLKGFDREKKPTMYVVRSGEDLSFLPIGAYDRKLDYSRFDIGGEPNARSQGQLTAYLFSDRGIYRPGDTFHMGLIVRAATWTRSVAGIPLLVEVVDPRGTSVRQEPVAMNEAGFAEMSYTPAETAPTGNWTVNLYIAKDGKPGAQIGSGSVQVKEFQPDRMKVAAKLSQVVTEGWVKPAQLKAMVDVENLFGTPAADRRVEATLTLRPAFPQFRSYPDYHFYDIRRAKEGYEESLQDGKTDNKGHAEFALDLTKYADATYQLYFLAKAYEAEGGRSVAAAAQSMVSSNDFLVGYKAVDNLEYVTRDAARSVNLVAIDPSAKKTEVKDLKKAIVETRYVSVLTKQDSGVFKYESKKRESTVSEEALTIPAAGLDVTLPTGKPGNFALVVRNAQGKELNRVEYSVAGDANVSRSLERNAELQLTLSKKDYAQGEAVDIAIRAPYAGSGLITIERDKVYAHAWFHADTTSSVQHITVPAEFEGNGYINVQYIRDPSSDEIFMSPLSFGVVPFSVNLDARRNGIKVETPALVKPGQTVTFHLTSPAPTKAVVFAVDEGILQVARYKLGDPLTFFFAKRMLEVNTSQILDLIIPDFEKVMSMAAPGGDADGGIGRQLNPFKRKRDKPVAYWSGIVDVDGSRDFSYQVPDYFNGKLRVMAVSVAADRIGTFEGTTTVRGDFVLSPNVPTTIAPGDEVEVSVGVANNLTGLNGEEVPVTVALKTGPQLQIVGAASQQVIAGRNARGRRPVPRESHRHARLGEFHLHCRLWRQDGQTKRGRLGAPGLAHAHATGHRPHRCPCPHRPAGPAPDVRRLRPAARVGRHGARGAGAGPGCVPGRLPALLHRAGDLQRHAGSYPWQAAGVRQGDAGTQCRWERVHDRPCGGAVRHPARTAERAGRLWPVGRNARHQRLHHRLCRALPARSARPWRGGATGHARCRQWGLAPDRRQRGRGFAGVAAPACLRDLPADPPGHGDHKLPGIGTTAPGRGVRAAVEVRCDGGMAGSKLPAAAPGQAGRAADCRPAEAAHAHASGRTLWLRLLLRPGDPRRLGAVRPGQALPGPRQGAAAPGGGEPGAPHRQGPLQHAVLGHDHPCARCLGHQRSG